MEGAGEFDPVGKGDGAQGIAPAHAIADGGEGGVCIRLRFGKAAKVFRTASWTRWLSSHETCIAGEEFGTAMMLGYSQRSDTGVRSVSAS